MPLARQGGDPGTGAAWDGCWRGGDGVRVQWFRPADGEWRGTSRGARGEANPRRKSQPDLRNDARLNPTSALRSADPLPGTVGFEKGGAW